MTLSHPPPRGAPKYPPPPLRSGRCGWRRHRAGQQDRCAPRVRRLLLHRAGDRQDQSPGRRRCPPQDPRGLCTHNLHCISLTCVDLQQVASTCGVIVSRSFPSDPQDTTCWGVSRAGIGQTSPRRTMTAGATARTPGTRRATALCARPARMPCAVLQANPASATKESRTGPQYGAVRRGKRGLRAIARPSGGSVRTLGRLRRQQRCAIRV